MERIELLFSFFLTPKGDDGYRILQTDAPPRHLGVSNNYIRGSKKMLSELGILLGLIIIMLIAYKRVNMLIASLAASVVVFSQRNGNP